MHVHVHINAAIYRSAFVLLIIAYIPTYLLHVYMYIHMRTRIARTIYIVSSIDQQPSIYALGLYICRSSSSKHDCVI
jgi:hypothetical protein